MRVIGLVSLFIFLLGLIVVGCAPMSGDDLHTTTIADGPSMLSSTPVLQRALHERPIVALEMFDLRGSYKATCSGILIRLDVVLTAAHCFDPELMGSIGRVSVSHTNDLEAPNRPVADTRAVALKVSHPLYNSQAKIIAGVRYPSYDHDLALVVLQSKFDSSLQPAALPETSETLTPGSSLVSYGYGKAVDWGQDTHKEQKLLFRSLQRGSLILSEKRLSDRIVTRESSKSSVCNGDSGGPAFLISRRGITPQLVAINSATNGKQLIAASTLRFCRGESVLQPIAPARAWIDATLRELGK